MNNTTNMNHTTERTNRDYERIEREQSQYYAQIRDTINKMEEDAENNPFSDLELERQLLDVASLERNNCGIDKCQFVFFNRYYEKRAVGEINNTLDSDDLEKLIQKIIIEGKFRNREQLLSYWGEIPYKVRTNDNCIEVVPWSDYGELTRIQPIRLIEKIESCAKNTKNKKIKVACLGKLYGDISILSDCLEERQIEISINEFIPEEKEQTFLCNDRLYDFAHYNDMLDVVNSYDYDVWGNFIEKNETIDNPFTYFGQTYDETTGLYYLRARYYDPSTGRFTQQDFAEDGYNWYVYGNQNPVMFVDYTGEIAVANDVIIAVAAGVAAASAAIIYYKEHTKNKSKKNWDKHTKKRPGDLSKAQKKSSWKSRSNKRDK